MELRVLRETLRRFGQESLAPAAAETERSGAVSPAIWAAMAKMELTGVMVSPDSGGAGAGLPEALVIAEELGRACGSTAWQWLEHTNATVALNGFASPALKESLLKPLARGERLGAALKSTEEGGGSDIRTLKATAVESDGTYIVNGTKVFQGLAGVADVYLVIVRDGAPDSQALSMLAIERDTPGLSFGPRERTMGLGGISVADIVMQDCRVPAGNLVGAPGGCGPILGAVGGFAMMASSAIALGMMQASLDETFSFLANRKVGPNTLGSLHGLQMQAADLLIDVESSRGLIAHAVREAGNIPLRFGTKARVTETAARVIDRCLLLHGNAGYSQALPLERRARDVRALAIHYGNNDVLRANLGQMVLSGLARS